MFVSACAEQQPQTTNYTIDSEFDNYVSKFEQQIEVDVELDIGFNKLEYPIVGSCYVYTTGYKEIIIDPDFWFNTIQSEKEELLFHELGHCVLNKEHDETILKAAYFYIPKSIMYPYVFGSQYTKFEQYYLDELKNSETELTNYL